MSTNCRVRPGLVAVVGLLMAAVGCSSERAPLDLADHVSLYCADLARTLETSAEKITELIEWSAKGLTAAQRTRAEARFDMIPVSDEGQRGASLFLFRDLALCLPDPPVRDEVGLLTAKLFETSELKEMAAAETRLATLLRARRD